MEYCALQFWAGFDGDTGRPGINLSRVDVPTVFVGLASMKARSLQAQAAMPYTEGNDVRRNMGGVLEVMPEGRDRVFRCRGSVRIGGRPHRWIAHGRDVERQEGAIGQFVIVQSGQLHEEVVRALAIHDGAAEGSFALLEEFRAAAV